jgi:hypothetical protein
MSIVYPFEIIYVFIAIGNKIILTDYTIYNGNFQQISVSLLDKIKKNKKGKIIYDNDFIFYYDNVNDITYMCLINKGRSSVSNEVIFTLLNDIKIKFTDKYTLKEIVQAYAFQLSEFNKLIKPIVNFYSDNPSYIKIGILIDENGNKIEIDEELADNFYINDNKIPLIVSKKSEKSNYDIDKMKSSLDEEINLKFQQISQKKLRKKWSQNIFIGCFIFLIIILLYYLLIV